ncbi:MULTISPECIES: PAS domain-containing protein [Rhodococcus]|uniref:PAS domain-containing protein n=1 Tax=Rhodococcus TaxID=1827 RepID=UPI0020A2C9EE|nr:MULTISPECIES: PAS domain-containing protein [Rhodococcus]MCZ4618723.1 PAS domain-containing protein [Rhodococcus qingshengii]MEA1798927.1 PAS domain-containing protein [Rhodococcus qingshengii]
MTAQTCDRVPVHARRRAHQLRRAASALRLRSVVMPRQFGGQTSLHQAQGWARNERDMLYRTTWAWVRRRNPLRCKGWKDSSIAATASGSSRIHRYEPGAITPTTKLRLSQKHSGDRPHVAETLEALRTSGGSFSSPHRIVDTRGTTRSVAIVGERLVDESGEIIGSSGFYVDVTETIDDTVTESANRAFNVLTWHSQETLVKVRDVAEKLLTGLATDFHMPDAVPTHSDHALLGL